MRERVIFGGGSRESSPILLRFRHSRSQPRQQNKSAKSRKLRRLALSVFSSSCGVLRTLASQSFQIAFAFHTRHVQSTQLQQVLLRNGVPSVFNTFNSVSGDRGSKTSAPLCTLCPLLGEIFKLLNRFPSTRTLLFIYFLLSVSSSSPIRPSQNNLILETPLKVFKLSLQLFVAL